MNMTLNSMAFSISGTYQTVGAEGRMGRLLLFWTSVATWTLEAEGRSFEEDLEGMRGACLGCSSSLRSSSSLGVPLESCQDIFLVWVKMRSQDIHNAAEHGGVVVVMQEDWD